MRWSVSILVLFTMVAYATGIPLRLHESEHRSSTPSCCAAHLLPASHLLHRAPAEPSLPPKRGCAICAQLEGLIATGGTPILLLDAGTPAPRPLFLEAAQPRQVAISSIACRGPPACS